MQYVLDKWNLHKTEKMVSPIECSTYPIFGKKCQLQIKKRKKEKGTKK